MTVTLKRIEMAVKQIEETRSLLQTMEDGERDRAVLMHLDHARTNLKLAEHAARSAGKEKGL